MNINKKFHFVIISESAAKLSYPEWVFNFDWGIVESSITILMRDIKTPSVGLSVLDVMKFISSHFILKTLVVKLIFLFHF